MFRQGFSFWSVVTIVLAVLILSPTLIIFAELLKPVSDNWDHIVRYVLPVYLKNTFILIFGVVALTSVMGIGSAWLVTQFEFAGKKWIEWMLMMPLAIPTYIMAYSYSGIFNFLEIHHIAAIDVKNITGLIFILSFALYPYMFAVCRVSFSVQNASVLEASRTMGKSYWLTFIKVALPLSRTAIIGGISLIMMELLNDYGAVKYFGVETITTGIFRTWFSMGDINTAIRICAIALLIVMIFLALEKIQRGRANNTESSNQNRKILRRKLKGIKSALAIIGCMIPVLLGFIFPLIQIIYWVKLSIVSTLNADFALTLFNTILLGIVASVTCIIAGIIFNFAKNWELSWLIRILTRLSTTGYSIPGAVIAIGILVPALFIDRYVSHAYGHNISLLNNTIIFLLIAYAIRFIAISNNTLESNFKKISPQLTSASRMMGKNSIHTLFRVHLPLVKPGLLSAFLLVFVEVIKELPLTLILRPFDYNTLSTRCFELASDERIIESGNYAFLIIITGLVPVFFLHQLSKTKHL
jgi:iron(III) transport system permease protein